MPESRVISRIQRPARPAVWAGFAAALIPFLVHLRTLHPDFFPDDSAETVTAAWNLGLPHPPGHPLGILLGRLALLAFPGPASFRMNLASATLAAACCFLVFLALRNLLEARFKGRLRPASATAASLAAAWLLGLSPTFWGQALGAKGSLYVLQVLFAALLLAILVAAREGETRGPRRFLGAAFLLGLGLANHWPIHAMALIGFLGAVAFGAPRSRRLPAFRRVPIAAALFLAGASPWLYLPMRSVQDPIPRFSDASHWSAFRATLGRNLYRDRERGILGELGEANLRGALEETKRAVRSQGRTYLHHLFLETGPLALPFLILGARALARPPVPAASLFLGWLFLALPAASFAFRTLLLPQSQWMAKNYILPANLAAAAATAAGLAVALSARSVLPRRAALAACMLLPSSLIFLHGPLLDRSADGTLRHFGLALLKSLPRNAVYVPETDEDTFLLWELRHVEGLRPDVRVLSPLLLTAPWGADAIRRAYPDLPSFNREAPVPPAPPLLFHLLRDGPFDRLFPGGTDHPSGLVLARLRSVEERPETQEGPLSAWIRLDFGALIGPLDRHREGRFLRLLTGVLLRHLERRQETRGMEATEGEFREFLGALPHPELEARAWLVRGAGWDRIGESKKAERAWRASFARWPNLEAGARLVEFLTKRGRHEEALDWASSVVAAFPRTAEARFNRGVALGHLGRFREMHREFEAAARLEPENAEYRTALERLQALPTEAGERAPRRRP